MEILIIEDDSDDRELFVEAVQTVNPAVEMKMVENGVEALDYLNQQVANHSPLPCLIVLDLNMPYMDGKATFQKIKSDNKLRDLPIVIFTSSQNPNDEAFYKSFGVEVITKPFEYSSMEEIIHRMLDIKRRG